MLPVVTFSVSALSRGATPWGPSVRRLDPRPVPAGCGHLPGGGPTGLPALWIPGKEYSPVAIYSLHVSNVSRAAGSSAVALLLVHHLASDARRAHRRGVQRVRPQGARRACMHDAARGRARRVPRPGAFVQRRRDGRETFRREAREEDHGRPAPRVRARERFRALEDFISWNITANGYACTYAIHTDKDGRNPHAHILVANRRIDPKTGRWAAKSRSEFALDANGRRIPVIDPDTGRQKIGARNRKVWKRVNVSNNPLDSKEFLERLRREWADSCNALLPGYAVIDHRSFKARGIERIPTIHEGYASREMEKRGGRGDLCEENRRIQP